MDGISEAVGADRGTLYLIDHAKNELVSHIAHLPEIAEIRLRVGEGVAGWVAERGQTVNIPEGVEDARFERRVDAETGYVTRSMLATPIRGEGRAILGVLQLLNRSDGDFTDVDQALLEQLADEVGELLEGTSLASQLRPGLRQPLAFKFNRIVGESPAMQAVFDRTARAARTDATVLIRGESGSGKEVIARAVHDNSPRRQGPFVKVDCAALPAQLIENELFGHERGAFTGADRAADGMVAAAEGGSLFLDEVGELPLEVQGRLLRLVQDRQYTRVGGADARTADVRFVAATHRDLEAAVTDGTFRQDLYYRLRVVQIDMPSLRDRGPADLDRLIDHFLFEHSRRHRPDQPQLTLSHKARAALHAHDWPGNVRELEHVMESAVVLARGPALEPGDLSLGPSRTPFPAGPHGADPDVFHAGLGPLREVERAYVEHVVRRCGGNKTEAAKLLGIGRNTLARKLELDSASE